MKCQQTLDDAKQRQQAIDPQRSYIVQAPAGSGKTELLTQRYLRLLSGVSMPEHIVALTFTRKAANEMRERIVLALQQAAAGAPASAPHQTLTLSLASEALARDKHLHWQILEQPNRLRIMTIDALCQMLTQAIPLPDKLIPYARISETPQNHYRSAARACLQYAIADPNYQAAIETVLQHIDNRQDYLLSLFSALLANRDQWLYPLYQAKTQDKARYETALLLMEQHELTRLHQSISSALAETLMTLTRRMAYLEDNPASPRYALRTWERMDELNGTLVNGLAGLLLTSQNTLRKSFDHHVGLKRGVCPNGEYHALKAASQDLLMQLSEEPDFLNALLRVRRLPTPKYEAEQWAALQALFTLLPLLVAHLQWEFTEHNVVDFTAISQQALQALGEEDAPTDLALYLDHSMHHMLIDEFQDTSIQQFQLISRLIHHWQPGEGKTIFLVGDPMQSIYRFRSAEVGLFLRAQQQGIGPIALTPLALTSNFRSTETIVHWVNTQFCTIFPKQDDIESGAVSFHPATSIRNNASESTVEAYQYPDRRTEAEALATCIEKDLNAYPNDHLAILVRSRNQLTEIIRVLKARNIPFQGVDIDLLATLPHLRDVWTITQALLMPANRLAWLALLRSPWCSLTLADLHSIANVSKHQSVYVALSRLDRITTLSEGGRKRAQFIYEVLHKALAHRYQQSLVDWIRNTLQALHINALLTPSEQDDLEPYWKLISQYEQDGQIEDLTQFKQAFEALYSKRVVPARLQIMTIHKSKGLEFDSVYLPSLSSKPANPDTPLLRWMTLPSAEHGEIQLWSPIKAAHQEECLLYNYLGVLDAQKSQYELQRLLYVAVTRAKKRLYLFDNRETASRGSFRHLLQQQDFALSETKPTTTVEKTTPLLHRLPLEYYQSSPLPYSPHTTLHKLSLTDPTPRLIGIAAHELLQWICDHHPSQLSEVPWSLAEQTLRMQGFKGNALTEAKALIAQQITQFMNTKIGQWIVQAHEQEHNEYALLCETQGELTTRIIDRTFYDQGKRWIIDFKTGQETQETHEKHRQQLNHYADLFSKYTSENLACGIYYLATNHWIAWETT